MFLKVVDVRPSGSQNETGEVTSIYQCEFVSIYTMVSETPGELLRFVVESTFENQGPIELFVDRTTTEVFLMNDDGKTVDRWFRWPGKNVPIKHIALDAVGPPA